MVRAALMRKLEKVRDPQIRDVLISFLEEAERIVGETVSKREFFGFVRVTNENFRRVWEAIDRLTEKVEQLAEAQRRTEERLNRLAERVEQLAEAQRRTEERLNRLAERVEQLAEAQRRTEERLNQLIDEHKETRRQVGGLANAFGYLLEDRAFKGLPRILKERFNIEVIEPLKRTYIKLNGEKYAEVNIFGMGRRDGREVYIIGECKTQLKQSDVDKFLWLIEKLESKWKGEKFLVLVTYQTLPSVMEYAEQRGLNLIFSYELPL